MELNPSLFSINNWSSDSANELFVSVLSQDVNRIIYTKSTDLISVFILLILIHHYFDLENGLVEFSRFGG